MFRGPTPVPATSTDSSPAWSRTTTSSVKSSETASRVSMSSMPRSSAMCGPLTRLTGSSVWPERIPTRAAMLRMRVSWSARRPRNSTTTRSEIALSRLVAGMEPHDHQLREVLGDRVAGLDELDAALLGHVRAVDQIDGLLGVAGENPDEGRDAEDACVLVGEAATELDHDAVRRSFAERLREAAELLAERHERRELLHHLGADGRDVDGRGDDSPGERRGHLLSGDDACAI